MRLSELFRRASRADSPAPHRLVPQPTDAGIVIRFPAPLDPPAVTQLMAAHDGGPPHDVILSTYLAQLVDDGQCQLTFSHALIAWDDLYALLASPDAEGLTALFDLPAISPLRPIVDCFKTLADPDFALTLVGWTDGHADIPVDRRLGPMLWVRGQATLLPAASWAVQAQIAAFNARAASERTQHENELAWGRIRAAIDRADGLYASRYLETTYVLTPETLRLPLTRTQTALGRVLTVSPTFEGAPDGWLAAFDGYAQVQPHYNLTSGGGRVRIVLAEPVRKVLEVIKREMPARRVAGARAEQFMHNPWAFLGESATQVIREDDFQQDRGEAGAVAAIFTLVSRVDQGRIFRVDLGVTEHFSDGSAQTDLKHLESPAELLAFLHALERGLRDGRERFAWDEYDLTLNAEATVQLELGQQLHHLWAAQPAEVIAFDDIYELDGYSERIEGIGAAKAIYVPVFQRPQPPEADDGSWTPTDLTPMVRVTLQGHEGQVLVPLTTAWVDQFAQRVAAATNAGEPTVTDPALPTPLPTDQAKTLAESFTSMLGAQARVKVDQAAGARQAKPPKQTLLVKTNFVDIDYVETRKEALFVAPDTAPQLPAALRPGIVLKAHQRYGVAWFQHLVSRSPADCRGALLADDMGLGKTLQLLTVLAWHYEQHPDAPPSLILAPKSLLENWENETRRFFQPTFPELLILYGEALTQRKQPLALIDDQLREKGIVELLKPHWPGAAKVIVSTYEVLTAFEFSLAKQPFAFVICDEAQRIKTPGTMVTLAVKKLHAQFRVACTGTPVENNLADLWCLFDFIQPGLLGALDHFGRTYRRPIECETSEQKETLGRLQALIGPQTLRRTKVDIAADLTKKLFAHKKAGSTTVDYKAALDDDDRLEIPISNYQRTLYLGGLKKLQEAAQERDGRKRAQLSFGALHLMKAVCAEPYCLPGTKFLPDAAGTAAHLAHSPKLQWLLAQLRTVRDAAEKAIIFTELRSAQAALAYFLREEFGLKPFIINGDSQGRQAYIDKFSASSGFDVIILSTLAAGAGLNVTAANHVFHFTRAWNPAKESQATDRAFRIGQQRDVYVYCPTIVADDFHTFEVRLDQLLRRKAGLAGATLDEGTLAAMLNGPGDEVRLSELVSGGPEGAALPKRYLTLDDVDRMDGFSFEVFCCLLWGKRGFQAQVTPKLRGDGGIDVVAFAGKTGQLLQCKCYGSKTIGSEALQEVALGAARYQARYPSVRFTRVAVTNQRFTAGALEQAAANQIEVVVRAQLEVWLGANPITNHEFDEAVLSWSTVRQQAA